MIKNLLSILLITNIFFQSCVPARKFEEISEKQEVCAVELKTLKTLKSLKTLKNQPPPPRSLGCIFLIVLHKDPLKHKVWGLWDCFSYCFS